MAAFGTYRYKITDELSGLEADPDTITLTISNGGRSRSYDWDQLSTMGTGKGSFSYSATGDGDGRLVLDMADIMSFQDGPGKVAVDGDTTVTVDFEARMTRDAAAGATGNSTKAALEYTANPVTGEAAEVPGVMTKVFCYQLDLTKVDKQRREDGGEQALPGTAVTVRLAAADGPSDTASPGRYVQADGSLGDSPHEFTTGADGRLSVRGIDAGTYALHETRAPEGYDVQRDDLVVAVSSELDKARGTHSLGSLRASASGGEQASGSGQVPAGVSGVDKGTGVVAVTMSDPRKTPFPGTGDTARGLAAACAVLAAGAAFCARSLHRRRAGRQ